MEQPESNWQPIILPPAAGQREAVREEAPVPVVKPLSLRHVAAAAALAVCREFLPEPAAEASAHTRGQIVAALVLKKHLKLKLAAFATMLKGSPDLLRALGMTSVPDPRRLASEYREQGGKELAARLLPDVLEYAREHGDIRPIDDPRIKTLLAAWDRLSEKDRDLFDELRREMELRDLEARHPKVLPGENQVVARDAAATTPANENRGGATPSPARQFSARDFIVGRRGRLTR
jgi:hypothetical protein